MPLLQKTSFRERKSITTNPQNAEQHQIQLPIQERWVQWNIYVYKERIALLGRMLEDFGPKVRMPIQVRGENSRDNVSK